METRGTSGGPFRYTGPMSALRITLSSLGLLGLGLLAATACDKKWDFECKAEWHQGDVKVWHDTFTYPEMVDEKAATARCREDMLEARPKRANSAICKCVGVD